MFSYDDKNDAHKISNYKWWKDTQQYIADVEIFVETTGISVDDIELMQNCLTKNIPFCLHNDKTFVTIFPKELGIKEGNHSVLFKTQKQLMNFIKLALFDMNKVFVSDMLIEDKKIKLLSC